MYNFADSSVTASAFTSGANTALTLVATTAGLTTTAALVIYFDDQATSSTVTGTVELGPTSLNALESITVTMGQVTVTGGLTDVQLRASAVTIGGTVTVGNSLTIGAGTVTIGAGTAQIGSVTASLASGQSIYVTNPPSGIARLSVQLVDSTGTGNYGTDGSPLKVSGTVTIGAGTAQIGSVTASISGTVPVSGTFYQATQPVSLTSTTVTVSSIPSLAAGTAQIGSVTASISGTVPISISSVTVGNSVTIGSLPAISGTVTANPSNGSLTTRFGSVTTANTAFATSAVTNANRKYLLIQNVTTASNVITVGIGFTPTTTQGIQLFSGAGLTFEGSYIPTGAVNLLSSVTASCFTILEA
jgi:hypothetical protein